MKSLKTAVIVVVLLGVLYGVYVVLSSEGFEIGNVQNTEEPEGEPPYVEMGDPVANAPPNNPGPGFVPSPSEPGNSPPINPFPALDTVPFNPSENPGGNFGASPAEKHGLSDDLRSQPRPTVPGFNPKTAETTPTNPPNDTPPPFPEVTDQPNIQTAGQQQRAWDMAEEQIAAGRFRDALATLSALYHQRRDLPAEQREKLIAWLDALAGKVIYSTEPHLVPLYVVKPGDTLRSIAQYYAVPWTLLYNINKQQVADPMRPEVGTELKVLRGPFNATVDTAEGRLTLFLDGLYAGNFDVGIGKHPALRSAKKQLVRHIDSGQATIDLGGELTIHPRQSVFTGDNECISLSPEDAIDICSILSKGAAVEFIR